MEKLTNKEVLDIIKNTKHVSLFEKVVEIHGFDEIMDILTTKTREEVLSTLIYAKLTKK